MPLLRAAHDLSRCSLCLPVCGPVVSVCADHHGLRVEPATPADKLSIYWLGVFDSNGKITNSITGIWRLRCTHSTGRIRPHAWAETRCACAPHGKQLDTIERSSILLYESEFTEQGRLDKVTKGQIEEVLRERPEHHSLLPSSWVPKETTLQDRKRGRGKSRRR